MPTNIPERSATRSRKSGVPRPVRLSHTSFQTETEQHTTKDDNMDIHKGKNKSNRAFTTLAMKTHTEK